MNAIPVVLTAIMAGLMLVVTVLRLSLSPWVATKEKFALPRGSRAMTVKTADVSLPSSIFNVRTPESWIFMFFEVSSIRSTFAPFQEPSAWLEMPTEIFN